MTEFRVYLAVILYPALIMLIWEPVASRWGREHRSFILPPDVRERSENNGRYLLFLKYALLSIGLFLLAGGHPWLILGTASHSHSWAASVIFGLGGGLSLFLCQRLLVLGWPSLAATERIPPDSSGEALLRSHPNLSGPAVFWLAIFFIGGLSEEFWRAVCIAGFRQNDYSPIAAILLSAVAYSMAHVSGIPARIPGGLAPIEAETIIGTVLGVIFVWSGSFLSLWLASTIYAVSNFCWLRRGHGKLARV